MKVVNTSGSATLYIDGSTGSNVIRFGKEGALNAIFGYNTTLDCMYIYDGGGTTYFNDGKIGIGDEAPIYTLDIGEPGDGTAALENLSKEVEILKEKKN